MKHPEHPPRDTTGADYTARLRRLEGARWKRLLDVQRPYRWNLQRLQLGVTLDIGCGIGRNLAALEAGSVGVDHNSESVVVARSRGLLALSSEEFATDKSCRGERFDSLLIAHVVEHMTEPEAQALIEDYLPHLRQGGTVVMITPQEVGHRSDSTHVRFVDHAGQRALAESLGLLWERAFSFPFPRVVGKVFAYNEFVGVARKR